MEDWQTAFGVYKRHVGIVKISILQLGICLLLISTFPSLIALKLNKNGDVVQYGEKILSWLMFNLAVMVEVFFCQRLHDFLRVLLSEVA